MVCYLRPEADVCRCWVAFSGVEFIVAAWREVVQRHDAFVDVCLRFAVFVKRSAAEVRAVHTAVCGSLVVKEPFYVVCIIRYVSDLDIEHDVIAALFACYLVWVHLLHTERELGLSDAFLKRVAYPVIPVSIQAASEVRATVVNPFAYLRLLPVVGVACPLPRRVYGE